ncbi:hypothetical protein C942_00865 [Photobacterium marinum]|uniref:Uncharacterized protein n=1 Tax=Photobacterium marinum TaxID=1056511 RepID=L8JE57_9GAMM|nr:hypothetical protein [Photobacterium marinum]ELR65779.1 hypothetical protein C942_00865 [Photobacterium marinum]
MEQPSHSLSQSISYLKHCSSQLMTNRDLSNPNVSAQRIHEIASVEYLELEQASKQAAQIQKELFRAIHALDGDDKAAVKGALMNALQCLNNETTIPAPTEDELHEAKIAQVACDPALAGC